MIEVLFIALEFAPVQQTGAFRSIKFAKYLPEHGIRPVVVTIDPQASSEIFGAPINLALKEDLGYEPATYYLEDDKPIAREESKLQAFLRVLLRTDDRFYERLRRSFEAQIQELVGKHSLKAIYVSLPPFGASRLALDALQKTGLPLVVDMRDAWSQWANSPFPTYWHYRAARGQERELLSRASAMLTVTDELSQMFQDAHPGVPKDRFHVVPNGIDYDFPERLDCAWGDDEDRFKVAYVGSYYYDPVAEANRSKRWFQRKPHRWLNYMSVYQEWIYRSPHFFFAAIEKLRETDPDAAEKFEFHQIGRTPDWLKSMADRFGMGEQLISHGVLPHDEVIATLDTMDACLVTSLKVPGGADYCLASKTFDYIQAHKLLLGFVAEGSQRKFLEAVHGSVICPPDAAVENAQKLSRIAKKLDRFNFCKDELKKYRRCATAGALANIVLSTLR